MGRDTWRFHELDKKRAEKGRIDPIWRGIGCVSIVLIGFVGYVFAGWFLGKEFVYIPFFFRSPSFAPWLNQELIVKLVVAFLFMLLSFAIVSAIYAVAFPIRLGEKDAPPMRRKDKERW